MQESGVRNGAYGADKFGFKGLAGVRWNLTEPALYEHAIAAGEASLVAGGALCAEIFETEFVGAVGPVPHTRFLHANSSPTGGPLYRRSSTGR